MSDVVYKDDGTKDCPCVVCGKMVNVTKFATVAKVKCEDCKNGNTNLPPEERPDYYPQWGDVTDKELRHLTCLSCGTDLELCAVTKSDQFGDIIRCQCPNCLLTYSISEQSRKHKWRMKKVPFNNLIVGNDAYEQITDEEEGAEEQDGMVLNDMEHCTEYTSNGGGD